MSTKLQLSRQDQIHFGATLNRELPTPGEEPVWDRQREVVHSATKMAVSQISAKVHPLLFCDSVKKASTKGKVSARDKLLSLSDNLSAVMELASSLWAANTSGISLLKDMRGFAVKKKEETLQKLKNMQGFPVEGQKVLKELKLQADFFARVIKRIDDAGTQGLSKTVEKFVESIKSLDTNKTLSENFELGIGEPAPLMETYTGGLKNAIRLHIAAALVAFQILGKDANQLFKGVLARIRDFSTQLAGTNHAKLGLFLTTQGAVVNSPEVYSFDQKKFEIIEDDGVRHLAPTKKFLEELIHLGRNPNTKTLAYSNGEEINLPFGNLNSGQNMICPVFGASTEKPDGSKINVATDFFDHLDRLILDTLGIK